MSNINLGISLFSFTQDYAKGEMNLEESMKAASSLGAKGIEVVGSQMLDTYPFVNDKFAEEFKEMCSRYKLEPICYGANTDRGMLYDRDLNEDELFASTLIDIETANKLGFKIMRVQFLLSPAALVRLEPYARKYDVKLGVEIHNPETPSTKKIVEYIEAFKTIESEYLGLIPDFGSFATKPNKPHWDQAILDGAQPELLELAASLRYNGVQQHEARQRLLDKGANEAVMTAFNGMFGFVTFYSEPDYEGLKRILPYCLHFHGKFHYVDENLEEASIPYPELLKIIYESDYSGYIMSEYEDQSGPSKIMVQRHINMETKILNSLQGVK